MAKPNKSKKKGSINVNFKGVDASGGGKAVPEGEYVVEVVKTEIKEGAKGDYINWTLKVVEGKHKGSTIYDITSLNPDALWNLRQTLEALGLEVPDSSMDIDLEDLTGLRMGVTVEHEEYKGKKKARPTSKYSLEGGSDDDEEDEDEEDEKPKKKSKEELKKGKKAPLPDEDDEDDDEDDEEEEPAPKKGKGSSKASTTSSTKTSKTKSRSDDEDEDDEDEEDEDDDDEPPVAKKKSKK